MRTLICRRCGFGATTTTQALCRSILQRIATRVLVLGEQARGAKHRLKRSGVHRAQYPKQGTFFDVVAFVGWTRSLRSVAPSGALGAQAFEAVRNGIWLQELHRLSVVSVHFLTAQIAVRHRDTLLLRRS